MGDEAYADFRRGDPRPGDGARDVRGLPGRAGLDRAADEEDRAAGRADRLPALSCWSTRDDMVELYGDPLAIWRTWAADVAAVAIDSGHHMAEDAPAELAAALRALLAR